MESRFLAFYQVAGQDAVDRAAAEQQDTPEYEYSSTANTAGSSSEYPDAQYDQSEKKKSHGGHHASSDKKKKSKSKSASEKR